MSKRRRNDENEVPAPSGMVFYFTQGLTPRERKKGLEVQRFHAARAFRKATVRATISRLANGRRSDLDRF